MLHLSGIFSLERAEMKGRRGAHRSLLRATSAAISEAYLSWLCEIAERASPLLTRGAC